jgi:hypothetical protein
VEPGIDDLAAAEGTLLWYTTCRSYSGPRLRWERTVGVARRFANAGSDMFGWPGDAEMRKQKKRRREKGPRIKTAPSNQPLNTAALVRFRTPFLGSTQAIMRRKVQLTNSRTPRPPRPGGVLPPSLRVTRGRKREKKSDRPGIQFPVFLCPFLSKLPPFDPAHPLRIGALPHVTAGQSLVRLCPIEP